MKSTKHVWKRCLSVLLVLCMIGAFILPHVSVQAANTDADLWVDPVAGNDTNDGLTEATALKTIQAAKAKAAELSADKDVIVILKGGTYDATDPIIFGKSDSGQNGHTITYRAASGETPIISGGTRLTGWTLHDAEKNIYVTDIPAGTELTRQFYVNGEHQRMASTEASPTDWQLLQTSGYVSPAVDSQDSNEYLILDLGADKMISSVVLYAGLDRAADNKVAGFPKDLCIYTSTDGEHWTLQVNQKDQAAPTARQPVEYVFASTGARFIKIDVTKLGNPTRKEPNKFFLALSEIAVGLAGEEHELDLALVQHLDLSKNLLEGAEISIGYLNGGNLTAYQLEPGSKMLDGDKGTYASANAQVAGWLAVNGGGNTQAFVMKLSDVAIPVGGVELTMLDESNPDRCWMTDFEIQVTADGENWVTVSKQTNYNWAKAKNNTNVFTFDPVPATQIRILAHKNEIATNDHYYMKIAEAAVYGTASLSTGATVTVTTGESAEKLTDGKLDSYFQSAKAETSADVDATIVVDLGAAKDIGAIRLFPNYVEGKATNYLTAAIISVSEDGTNYTHVMELNNIAAPAGGAQLLLFSKGFTGRYVKIEPVLVNGDCLELREVEIVPVKADNSQNPDVVTEQIALSVLNFGYYNSDGSFTEYVKNGSNRNNAVDGNLSSSAISGGQQYHWLSGNGGALTPAIVVKTTDKNGAPSLMNSIELTVAEDGLGAPYSYTIDVVTSPDSDNWTTVYQTTQSDWSKNKTIKIRVPEVEIYKLRVCCSMVTSDAPIEEWVGAGWTSLCINELAAFYVADNTNPYSLYLCTQGENASDAANYKINKIEAKNDNEENMYNANKAIDGTTDPDNQYGWLVPESYDLAKYGNMEDIEIHVLRLWYHSFFHVTGGSGDGTELYGEAGTEYLPTWAANHYAFIDCVGEWYIDKDELKIYYKADGTMEGKEAVLPVTEQVVIMSDASNIIFDGVSFQHTTWTTPSVLDYPDCQANTYQHPGQDWVQVPAGIKVEYSRDITFTNCEVANMGTMGFLLTSEGGENTENITIENSYIHDISYNGITVGEVYGHHGYQSWYRVDDTVIRNNYITRIGLDMFDSTAILATYTNGTIIDHNEVCYVPYSGISIGWGWENEGQLVDQECGDIQVTNNLIHNVMKTNRDGGNFYSLGHSPNSKLSGNYIYNSWDYGETYENGLYLDMGSSFWEVSNNVVGERVGYWLHMWTASIRENYWHDNFYVEGTKQREDGTDNVLENNTAVPKGEFSKYPKAMEIINNAGLLDESVKEGAKIGFASQHQVTQSFYPGNSARYIHAEWGWDNIAAEGQVNKTSYDSINREIIVTVAPTADLTKVVFTYELKDGWTCADPSGATYDFTSPRKFVLKNGSKEIVWNVTVKNKTVTSGEVAGEEVNFGDMIADSEATDWSAPPVRVINGMAFFNTRSGYTAQTFGNDTIYTFDFKVNMSETTEDWIGISLRNQDPYVSCLEGNTEYHINLGWHTIEVFKFDKGVRTVLYGFETGFEAVYGEMPNKFLTSEDRHSIKCGAIDVDGGVRLFMYVDGNLVFDFVDENSPLQTTNNYFVVYPETSMISIGKYTNINTAPDRSALDEAIEIFAGLNEADYTAESYAAAVAAMAQVETILASVGGVTEDEINEAYTILSTALNALVRTSGGTGPIVPEKPNDPTEPSKPGTTDPDGSGKTGDNTLLIAFGLLMALSVAGVAAVLTLKRRMAA